MKVKKYTGSSLEKIRDAVARELGEDAVIVNIKNNIGKGGILSLGKKAAFEVIAAVEEPANADNPAPRQELPPGESFSEFIQMQKEQYRGLRQSIKMLDEKLAEVDERMTQIRSVGNGSDIRELENIHDSWRQLTVNAVRGINPSAAPSTEDWHEALASLIPTAGGIMFRHTPQAPPDVYVLTGPTGVGKTTTLAKLAARCVLAEKLNVGLITTDTFRVAAVDQLREYSSLLGVEIAVAFSSEELDAQLRRFHDKDVVFIDTPGRSPYDLEGLQLTRNMLEPFFGRICTLMIFPANIRKDDASALFAASSCLKPSALIISKTDEASRCDGITTMLECSQLPVLYLTDGQRVPEDIHCASPGLVASLVIPFVKTSEPLKAGGAR